MKAVAICLLGASLATSPVWAKDWVFSGSVRMKAEYQLAPTNRPSATTNWASVFVRINTDQAPLEEILFIFNPTNGVLDLELSRWLGEPEAKLKCPLKIPALTTAKLRRRCRLIFTADRWDLETKNKGQITLKSFEWIPEGAQRNAPANGSQPIPSETNSTSSAAGSRR